MRISEPCPECGKPIIEGDGLLGTDIRCPDYPSCAFRIYLDQSIQDEQEINPHDSLFREALEKTRKKLLDLTRRNALLSFKESQRTIRIIDELPDVTFEFLIENNKELELLPEPEKKKSTGENTQQDNIFDSNNFADTEEDNYELPKPGQDIEDKHQDRYLQTPFTAKPLERRAKRLKQLYRSSIEETGCNMLYLAIGFLEFYEHNNSEDKWLAPLILVPIQVERKQIDRRSNSYKYAISYTGEDITTNLSLAKKLAEDFDLVLPDFEEKSKPELYFKNITNMISDKEEWRVAREMIIGMFSFSKLLMYLDLDHHRWPKSSSLSENNNLRTVLIGSEDQNTSNVLNFGEEYNIDTDPRAKEIPLIVDADSSQHSAMVDAVMGGENIVIEGPPGTGKSQTITNIIGACLKLGKSILFVSEKKAALDVVRNNLDKVNLGDFCLELHSHKTQKGRLHQDIKKRIEKKNISRTNDKELLSDLIREKKKLIQYSEIAKTIVGPNDDPIHKIFWIADRYYSEIDCKLSNINIKNAQVIKRDIYKETINTLEDYSKILNEIPSDVVTDWSGLFVENIIAGDEVEIDNILEKIIYITEAQINYINDTNHEYKLSINNELNEFNSINDLDIDIINLPPEDLDRAIAVVFLEKENISLAEELNTYCKSYYESINKADKILGLSTELIKNYAGKINTSIENIVELGHKRQTPITLESYIPILDKVIKILAALPKRTDELAQIFQSDPVTISDYLKLKEEIKVVYECPKDFTINYHDNNLTEDASHIFEEASTRFEYLINRLSEKANIFDTRKLPPNQEIAEAITILRENNEKFYRILISEYRNTKRFIKTILSNKKAFSRVDFIDQLTDFKDIVEQVEHFQENANYNEYLGNQFCGLNTNWQNLKNHIVWCNKFGESIGSYIIARNVIAENNNIKEHIKDISGYLNNALDLLDKTLKKIQLDIDYDLSISQLTDHLANHLSILDINLKIFSIEEINNIESGYKIKNKGIDDIKIASSLLIEAIGKERHIENKSEFKDVFSYSYYGVRTDTDKLLEHANWLLKLHNQQLYNIDLLGWIIEYISTDQFKYFINVKNEIHNYVKQLNQLVEQLNKYGNTNIDDWLADSENKIYLDSVLKINKRCRDTIHYAQIWSDYCKLTKRINEYGLDDIKSAIDNCLIDYDLAIPAYKSILYRTIARNLLKEHKILGDFSHISYEGIINRFKKLDKELLNENTKLITNELLNVNLPSGVGYGKVRDFTEASLIKREINKKRAHVPIRQLVRRAGNALKALKPCFMMSPMSVAQYLVPGQVEFDVLVIDEASQVRPQDALGAVARAKQMIIVGGRQSIATN
jgi:Protein of unknown function (DUF4011)/AAA domain